MEDNELQPDQDLGREEGLGWDLFLEPVETLVAKNPPANAGDVRDTGSIPGSGRFPGGGHGNPLQYSCLEKPMVREAWQATVHGVTESDMTEVT